MMKKITLPLCLLLLATQSTAQVYRMQIDRREPFANGQSFGNVGPYEKLIGSLYIEVDPAQAANQRITDLQHAPRNARGKVEFRTDFYLIKPVDPSKGSGKLLYDVHNRGGKVALGSFNGAGGNDPNSGGTGFLFERGFSVLWTGWSGDVLPGSGRLTADLPIALENGRPVTGRIYTEWESGGYQLYRNNFVTQTRGAADSVLYAIPFDWGPTKSYPTVTLDNRDAVLTMRPHRAAAATEVAREKWRFARMENGQPVPDSTHVYVSDGYRLGWLYDLVYTGRGPRLTGLGFAAVRDPVSFFRYATADAQGNPNPLAGALRRAYAFGVSQSGRYLNHFVFEGFNGDTQNRLIFDGIFAEVAGSGKGMFNYRFGQTTRHQSQHEDNLYPSDFFPFTSVQQEDHVTGQRGDNFERARRSGHMPKFMYFQTSTEYWSRAASLLHTDVNGTRDVALDPNVRIYQIAGAAHTSMAGGHYDNPLNRVGRGPFTRALFAALDEWVVNGTEPPASRYPRIADGTLVTLDVFRAAFPKIPGVRAPAVVYAPMRIDPGPRWYTQGIADNAPPKTGAPYRTLVPRVNADGNEVAGLVLPDVSVPIATYTGWNPRTAAWGADGMLTRWMGSYLEFPRTAAERQQRNDPRRSIQERYPTKEAYLQQYERAVRELEQQRLLLPADAANLRRAASERNYWQ